MKKTNFKKYKINQLQKIQQTYKYLYLFHYQDLTVSEYIILKKKLIKFNCKCIILKKKLINNFFNIQGQSSVLAIYSNSTDFPLINFLLKLPKINLLVFLINGKSYSPIKLNQLLKLNPPINAALVKSFSIFLYYLRTINKMADIT